ncbi:MAG TPA: lysylphosphatidylglycerol synthase domain-containing protein [Rhizomicrobium sp.]|nr:lysylphosphatidylglycerol synthase domain-containing protein [Rhizomicrobium sp.]
MKGLSIALAIAGLALGTLLVGWYGFGPVAKAMLSVGGWGFAAYCAWQLVTMVVLGLAWRIVAPPKGALQLLPFVWGRMVRDSAAACLPFSMIGGFVFGVRAAALCGLAWSVATLSTIVDLTAEFLAEIAFTVAGVAELFSRDVSPPLTMPFAIGLAAMLIAGAAVLRWWKGAPPLFARMGRRIMGDRLARQAKLEMPERELEEIYGHSGRMAAGTAAHFVGWICKGAGNWIAFRLLGLHVDVMAALAIEALLHALLIPAVIVPGYAGVQEAGYAALGTLFGIPPNISIAVSLLRRARDLAIGIPILLVWQFAEARRLRTDPLKRVEE